MLRSSASTNSTTLLSRATDVEGDQTILEAVPVITHGLDGGWFGKISTTLILLLGTFGNVMTVIILRRLRSGWSAMNVYLTALALSDTAMLYSGALPMWTRKVLGYDAYASHVLVCKLGMYVMTTTATLSAWLLVSLTAQRAASVVWPHRVNVICTRHKSIITIVIITTVCSLLQSHTVYGFDLVRFGNGTTERCTFGSADYQEFWLRFWVDVGLFLYSVLPCVCLIVSNVVLGWKLTVAMKEAKEKFSTGRQDQTNSRRKKASSVTLTIIIVSVAFVLITVPLTVYNTFFHGFASSAIDYFLYDFLFVFGMSNFAWNFYLYCLTGSKFRREFRKVILGCCVPVTLEAGFAPVTETSQVSQGGTSGQEKRDAESNNDF